MHSLASNQNWTCLFKHVHTLLHYTWCYQVVSSKFGSLWRCLSNFAFPEVGASVVEPNGRLQKCRRCSSRLFRSGKSKICFASFGDT